MPTTPQPPSPSNEPTVKRYICNETIALADGSEPIAASTMGTEVVLLSDFTAMQSRAEEAGQKVLFWKGQTELREQALQNTERELARVQEALAFAEQNAVIFQPAYNTDRKAFDYDVRKSAENIWASGSTILSAITALRTKVEADRQAHEQR